VLLQVAIHDLDRLQTQPLLGVQDLFDALLLAGFVLGDGVLEIGDFLVFFLNFGMHDFDVLPLVTHLFLVGQRLLVHALHLVRDFLHDVGHRGLLSLQEVVLKSV